MPDGKRAGLPVGLVIEHDKTAVRLQVFENQVHDAFEQLLGVERGPDDLHQFVENGQVL